MILLADQGRRRGTLHLYQGTVETLFRWMTERFEKRLPNTSYGVHDAETAAQAGGMALEELERCFYTDWGVVGRCRMNGKNGCAGTDRRCVGLVIRGTMGLTLKNQRSMWYACAWRQAEFPPE